MDELIDEVITYLYREFVYESFVVTAIWTVCFVVCLACLWNNIRGNPK